LKNKKLFAILTLVCFMFTLMPMAAFADVDEQQSYVLTVKDNPTIKVNKTAKIQFNFEGTTDSVYVWFLKDGAKVPANSVEIVAFGADATENATAITENAATPYTANIFKVSEVAVGEGIAVTDEFEFKFTDPGEYKVYASIDMPNDTTAAKAVAGVGLPLETIASQNVITVKPAAEVTADYVMVDMNGSLGVVGTEYPDNAKVTLRGITANNASTKTVKLQLLDSADGDEVANTDVKISSGSANVVVSKEKATTNALGVFSFDITAAREGEYKVYVSVGQYEMVITVGASTTAATSIVLDTAAKAPTALDDEYRQNGLTGKVGFRIYDATGSEVTGANYTAGMDNAYSLDTYDATHDAKNFVALTSAPAGSDLDDENFGIAWMGDEYGWTILPNANFDEEGTYEFKVVLDNGAYATASITVKEFGTPVGIIFTYDADSVELASSIAPKAINWIDANYVTKAIDSSVEIAVSGYAVDNVELYRYTLVEDLDDPTSRRVVIAESDDFDKDTYASGIYSTWTLANTQYLPTITVSDDEKYVGSEITVTAVDERYNLVATTTLTVADEAKDLAFSTNTLEVDVNNKVVVNVVDRNGNNVTPSNVVAADASVIVLDKPEGAKVSATVNGVNAAKGQFNINLTSSKVGNVTVQAILKYETAAGVYKYYTGTQVFAVGTDSVGDVVVMSIGSNQIVVNDKVSKIAAAPMIKDARTFVPFRALAEAFGAEVEWVEATQSVVAELNGVKVVMVIGEEAYTVNGVAKTADVAPFINGASTMVPVRFVAEAFGINVIPTYDENGATADILFNL